MAPPSETPPDMPIALEDREIEGAILSSPSAARNKGPIADRLANILPQGVRVLEFGSGTGEHAEAICQRRPDLTWTPSDPDAASRASCAARAARLGGGMRAALEIDLALLDWETAAPPCDAFYCANTIHISPWATTEGVARGASALLPAGGMVILYGPFLEGADSALSNLRFDADLKARNASWGVRERAAVEALFSAAGLPPAERIAMPANNQLLVFRKP